MIDHWAKKKQTDSSPDAEEYRDLYNRLVSQGVVFPNTKKFIDWPKKIKPEPAEGILAAPVVNKAVKTRDENTSPANVSPKTKKDDESKRKEKQETPVGNPSPSGNEDALQELNDHRNDLLKLLLSKTVTAGTKK